MCDYFKIDNATWSFEDGFVRFFLLKGRERAVMIDSGMTKNDARSICERVTELPITLMNTHGDPDHVSGTGAFDEMHIGMDDFTNCRLAERFPDTKPLPLLDGQVIDLGGRRLKAIYIPGHTKGSFAFLDMDRRRLFVGDTVQDGDIFMFGPHRDKDKLAASLRKLIEMQSEYDEIVASHGKVILPADYPKKVLRSWQKVVDGEIEGICMEMHGNPVQLYKTESCGFIL